ncbi:MAG: hypothetical protein GX817_07195, partial [Elusimicrobia bacterium]|nr:hypothetical protein [Elusimicrobiota bacterium]
KALKNDYRKKEMGLAARYRILEKKEAEYSTRVGKVRESYRARLEALENEFNGEREKFQDEITKLRADHSQTVSAQRGKILSLGLAVDELKERLAGKDKDDHLLTKQLKEYQLRYKEIQHLVRERDQAYKEQIRDLVAAQQREEKAYKLNIARLQESFSQIESALREEIENKKGLLKVREKELRLLSEEVASAKNQAESLSGSMEEKFHRWKEKEVALNGKVSELSLKLNETLGLLSVRGNEIAFIREEVASSREKLREYSRREDELITQIRNLALEKGTSGMELTARVSESENLRKELSNLRADKLRVEEENSALIQKITEEKSRFLEETGALKNQLERESLRASEAEMRAKFQESRRESEIQIWKTEAERLRDSQSYEKEVVLAESQFLKEEIEKLRAFSAEAQQAAAGREEQVAVLQAKLEDERKKMQGKIDEAQSEISELKERMRLDYISYDEAINKKEKQLSLDYQRRSDEREAHWQSLYTEREKEHLGERDELRRELDNLRKEKISVERQWNVRLKDKEDDLRDLQLAKAQNESRIMSSLRRYQKEYQQLRAKSMSLNSALRDREEEVRELRLRFSRREIKWKRAYSIKQKEVRHLTYELQKSNRGTLRKILDALTGHDRKPEPVSDSKKPVADRRSVLKQ